MNRLRLLLLSALVGLAACGGDATTPSAVANAPETDADDIVFGMQQMMTTGGIRTAVLESDTAYLYQEKQKFDLVGVHLEFFGKNGQQTGTLTSRTGEYDQARDLFIARGNVVLDTQDENGTRHLETPVLHYSQSLGQVWSDTTFVLTQDGRTTRGSSFRSDVNGGNWTATSLHTEGVKTAGSTFKF